MMEDEMSGACSTNGEVWNAYRILVGKSEGMKQLGRPGIDGRLILKGFIRKQGVRVWIGFIWLKLGYCGGLLWTKEQTYGFHKRTLLSGVWMSMDMRVSRWTRVARCPLPSDCFYALFFIHWYKTTIYFYNENKSKKDLILQSGKYGIFIF